MNTNRVVILVSFITCLIIIGVPTLYKVIENNHYRLHEVTEKYIIEAASKCYYEKKCDSRDITLKELYDKKYITEEVIDPVSKIVYNNASFAHVEQNNSYFTEVK